MIIEVYGQLKFQYKLIYRVRKLHFSKSLIVKGTISSGACENSGKTIAFHVDHVEISVKATKLSQSRCSKLQVVYAC